MNTAITIHRHASGETGIFANAYLVESKAGVVAVDATLTNSESKSLRARLNQLNKPLLAILITHPHPDHVAGITQLVGNSVTPILALESVERLMRTFEEPKRAQWGPVYGDEWVQHWTYPNQLLQDNDSVVFDGITYRVHDLGAGGDCDANSIWVIEDDPKAAFIGDLVFDGTHSYIADGHSGEWLVNLDRAEKLLRGATLYPGHGTPGTLALLQKQRDYLLTYRATVQRLAQGKPTLTDAEKTELTQAMERYAQGAGLSFLIAHSADAVATELASRAS